MKVWDWIKDLFADEPEMEGPPIEYDGKTYTPYRSAEDPNAVWPNATCPACRGLNLKRELYWNKETETYYHPACIRKLAGIA